ncbi:pullulanase [Paenibacillus sp. F411]|uniref:pullulanase n=1 Tax=Paenibacillus sp. F411 TaxID=2820239 RepID=UPI001AB00E4D|nr:pullulanase [Paenibacillus sp. F411]MBO2944357.1 pullulanase [Paenibacillus sp. F411]
MLSAVQSKKLCSIILIVTMLCSLIGIPPVQAATDSQALQVVVVGDLQSELGAASDWKPDAAETAMTPAGPDEYRFTGKLPAGEYEYKVAVGGTWDQSYGNDHYTSPGKQSDNGNIKLSLSQETEVTFYYNHKTHAVADSSYYIPLEQDHLPRVIGSFQNGIENSPALLMNDDSLNGIYSVTADVYAGDHQYQVALGDPGAGRLYPEDGTPMSLNVERDAEVTFTYDADTHEIAEDIKLAPVPQDPGLPVADGHLRVHYQRTDANYEGWALWIFNDVAEPSQNWPKGATPFPEGQQDHYGAFVDLPIQHGASKIGLVVMNRMTEQKDGEDKVFSLITPEMNEVWLKQDTDEVYTYEPVDLPADTVRIHYQREDQNYSAYALWLWGDVASPSTNYPNGATRFSQEQLDGYGAYLDVPLQPQGAKINLIVLDPAVGDNGKDGGDKSFSLADRYRHLFIREGDNTVYTSPYGEVPTGLISAEVLSQGKLRLSYTMTAGLTPESLKEGVQLKSGDQSIGITEAAVTGPLTVELTASFTMDQVPLQVTFLGKTVTASKGWRYLDQEYAYDGNDLGAVYADGEAVLKLWAPTASKVTVDVYGKDDSTTVIGTKELQRQEQGVWSVRLERGDFDIEDFRGAFYQYEVTHEGVSKRVLDPYAKSMAEFRVDTTGKAGPDGDIVGKAAIVDLSETNPEGYDFAQIPGYEQREDAIIWEIHVRDFTSDPSIEDDLHNAQWGSFEAFKHKLDYIKSLGVTHVQLLPVMAWYYGDESKMKNRELNYSAGNNEYNWGYDPHSYFSPDGAYSVNPQDPELRIRELKNMIDAIHEAEMGVVLDVVYTHMAKSDFLNDIVPGYYAFQDVNGKFLGDFGNNLATNRKMAEKLMVDSVKYWFEEYKIDGMRWDMMGDATQDAVQRAYDAAAEINPDALFIGEGWITFKGAQADPALAGQGADQNWMDRTDDVGVFSDEFRNALKSGYGSEGEPRFITGGKQSVDMIFNNIKAQPGNMKEDDPGDVVQYIEAHDNLPLYDIIAQATKKDPANAENDLEIHKRIRLGNLLILTSQGTAFLHAGQEYGRTKQWLGEGVPQQKYHELKDQSGKTFGYFVHDSYDSSDAINKFDWEKATNKDVFPVNHVTKEYTAGLIQLRKSSDAFRLGDQELINSRVSLLSIPEIGTQDVAIGYTTKATDASGQYYVFVNGDKVSRTMTLSKDLTSGTVIVDNDEAGTAEVEQASGFELDSSSITLEPLTAVVIKTASDPIALTSVAADQSSYTVGVGQTRQAIVHAIYNDESRRIITKQAAYVSSNADVASVSSSGLITGHRAGTAVITISYQGSQQEVTVKVTKVTAGKRYVQINYIRPDADYEDWNLWIWDTGVKNDQIDFEVFESGMATVLVEVAANTSSIGFVLRKGTGWDGTKQDYPDDRNIPLTPGEAFTKVYVTSMKKELTIVPSPTGPLLEGGNITFVYRDEAKFRENAMDTMDSVSLKIGSREEVMTYDAEKEWFSYTWHNAVPGTHEYSFLVTTDGETVEVTDPKNTQDGKSVVIYVKPVVNVTGSVQRESISYKEHAVLKVAVSVSEEEGPVSFQAGYLDLSSLGGSPQVKLDLELLEQSIAVKEGIPSGRKSIGITLIDQYGNFHKGTAEVTVKSAEAAAKAEFDWDEARIYFVLTDRFMDGDASNNENVNKDHLEAYHGGDFRGLIDKLDYIQELGVNTLWITPIVDNIDYNVKANSNGIQYGYHGYWAKDFTKLDEHLGDLDTFKELIDKAHDRGIKIMVDVVLNHTGYGLKPGDTAPVAQDDKARFEGMLRDTKLSTTDDPLRGELSGLPDLITEDPDVRRQIIDWQAGWLERARTDRGDTIDYFRVDTVKHVEEATWKAFKNALTAIDPEFKLIGEYYGGTLDNDGGTLQSGQMDGLLDFGFKGRARDFVNGRVEDVESYLAEREARLDNTQMMGQFLSSHDENGFLSHYVNGDKAKLMTAAALQITSKGQPVIYYGEELGRSGSASGDLDKGNFSENRTDMPWDQVESEKKLLEHYRKLLKIRAEHSGIFSKGVRTSIVASDDEKYLAFDKEYEDKHLVTALHVGTQERTVSFKVPFPAGSMAADLYSGKQYKVKSDQTVSVLLPAMADGGTVILASAAESGNGNGNGNDGSGPAPGSGAPVSTPAKGTVQISEALLNNPQAPVSVKLGAGDQELLLPIGAGDLLNGQSVEVSKDGIKITLPSALLQALQKLVSAEQQKASTISLLVQEAPLADTKALVLEAERQTPGVNLKPGSVMYDLHLSVKAAGGAEWKLEQFESPVTLTFDLLPGINASWAGVYHLQDDGSITYAGGRLKDGQIEAEAGHFSKYAVLEYEKIFTDLNGHWAQNAVKELAAKHIVQGTSAKAFSPAQKLTRAQFAAMLVRALGLEPVNTAGSTFKDVSRDAWYAADLQTAYQHGLVSGKGGNVFAPNDSITREEMAVMLVRAYTLQHEAPAAEKSGMKDQEHISHWAEKQVNQAAFLGLMQGHPGGAFEPKGWTTRAQSAQAVLNLLKALE